MSKPEAPDVAFSLLHTADWHLGRRFPRFPEEDEQKLTRARREVVTKILDLAESRRVDAVLCAGDLFDEYAPDSQWWKAVVEDLAKRKWARQVVLLPGNHDPLVAGSVYEPGHAFRRRLPAFVHVVDRPDFELELADNVVLYALPCTSHAGQNDPALQLPARTPGDERIRIGLVHGQTFDIEGHQTNFPIARDAAQQRGLDYLAIGDTHGFRDVQPDATVPTVYPGAPEPATFGETDAGHVALTFFPRDRRRRAIVESHRVGTWQWSEQTCSSIEELRALKSDDSLRKCVLKLQIEMRLPITEYDEAGAVLNELQGSLAAHPRVGVLLADRTGLRLEPPGQKDFPDDLPPVLKSTIERLVAAAEQEPERAERALHHLFQLVKGR